MSFSKNKLSETKSEIKDKEEIARLKAELESTRAQLSATKYYNHKRSQLERWRFRHSYHYGACMEEMRLGGPKIKDKMNTSYNWDTKFSKTNPAKIIELELLPNKVHKLKKMYKEEKKKRWEVACAEAVAWASSIHKETVKYQNVLKRIYSVIYDMEYSPIGRYQSGQQKLLFDSLKAAAKYPEIPHEYVWRSGWRNGRWCGIATQERTITSAEAIAAAAAMNFCQFSGTDF